MNTDISGINDIRQHIQTGDMRTVTTGQADGGFDPGCAGISGIQV
jgi:hypothetical protein